MPQGLSKTGVNNYGRGASPQLEHTQLSRRHNELETTRPVIFCDTENGCNEIIAESSCTVRES